MCETGHHSPGSLGASFGAPRESAYTAADRMAVSTSSPLVPICRERVISVQRRQDPATCALSNQGKVVVSRILATYVAIGDEITYPIPTGEAIGAEIFITKPTPSGTIPSLYQAQIGYVTQPKPDKRNQLFVSAEVRQGALGISSVFLPCEVLRDYFYRIPPQDDRTPRTTLYDLLRIPASATPSELRVAFKLRNMELEAAGGPHSNQAALERAFNIVGQPELRAVYDALLADPEVPAVFPYGGFGSLLVAGERSRDGQTFFARRILAFSPERRRRRFHTTLRKCEFYEGSAVCHDVRRKLEFWLDPALLHIVWDPTWNQWKHLSGTKMEVDGTFVLSGKYRKRHGQWQLVTWETALPSRLELKVPADFANQLDTAKATYHRFGQYADALEQIRLRLEYHAIEKSELERLCSPLRLPGDFDLAQINWRPDYDPFFYHQLACRARRVYLFRDEYIFDLEKAVVTETPQLGHATYVFAKPRSLESFLALYTKITKDDIRRNRDNASERLKFLGRVVHGTNPRAWLKEVKQYLGEKIDFRVAMAE